MNETVLKPMTLVARRSFVGTQGANKDKPFFVVDVLVPLSMQDNEKGFFGFEIKQVYLDKEIWLQITKEDLGKRISFSYEGNEFGGSSITGYKLQEYLLLGE